MHRPHLISLREIPASEKTALEAVMEADEERVKLEALAEMLALETDDASQEYLMQVFTPICRKPLLFKCTAYPFT